MRSVAALSLLAGILPVSPAWEGAAGDLAARCRQPDLRALSCDYRTLSGTRAEALLRVDGTALPGTPAAFPWPGAKSALLFLVDTSDPGRAAIVERNIGHVESLARAARTHHQIGLARFDKDLEILAPIGSSADAVTAAARALRATGMTTELYRNVLQAVRHLSNTSADRRFVILLSDGLAEDTAYSHDDVIAAAHAAGIGIVSLGFPRSVARSVALQTLRRLSEETAGLYQESDLTGTLPAGFEQRVFAGVDSGGGVEFVLPAMTAESGTTTVTLVIRSGTGAGEFQVPVRVPQATKKAAGPAAPVPATGTAAATPAAATAPVPRTRSEKLVWYGVPGLLLILILFAAATLFMLLRQPRRPAETHAPAPQVKPFAYLISQTSHPKRYPIGGAIWRIGRSKENELVLEDISISRRHAEIQRGPDGNFTIIDRGARNGVFVNGKQVQKQALHEGDMIEVGDVTLRFTESGADEQLQEETAVQHTRQPRIA
jgi:hypothetical protein